MAFIAGVFVGAMIGVFVMCLMVSARNGDDLIRSENHIKTDGDIRRRVMPSGTTKAIKLPDVYWVDRKDYVKKDDLRKLVETMRSAYSTFGEGFAEGYSEASRDWADELEKLLEVGDGH